MKLKFIHLLATVIPQIGKCQFVPKWTDLHPTQAGSLAAVHSEKFHLYRSAPEKRNGNAWGAPWVSL